ncbi:MAG: hypothetical protein EU531_10655 [Promethearchaeota archaeon]|nr:MAG: hypothetical protein EU531_10655 [Candidatus Lokiarchaeota archaeon]
MDMKEISNKESNKLIFFNQALEYFDYPVDDISNESEKSAEMLFIGDSDLLRDEMLSELDHLKELIINNPDAKIKALSEAERKLFFEFIRTFSICPICGNQNHYFHLKKFYFSEDKKIIKESLLNLMRLNYKKFKLKYGVPCCNCFKKCFEEKLNE